MDLKASTTGTNRFRGNQRASALAEVLVAVLVLAVMFATLYGGLSYGFAVTQATREDLRATQILVERMEGIRLFNWNQLTDTNLNPVAFTRNYYPMAKPGESKGVTYTGTVSVTDVDFSPAATYANQMKKISVTITWATGKVQHTRTMFTYAAKYGMQNYIYAN
jgi:Tfp pilus assembly protein PilV